MPEKDGRSHSVSCCNPAGTALFFFFQTENVYKVFRNSCAPFFATYLKFLQHGFMDQLDVKSILVVDPYGVLYGH